MKRQTLLLTLLSLALVFVACQKEYSSESSKTPSTGSLRADGAGDCLPKTVVGSYEEAQVLDPDANYIEIEVDVVTPGSYIISTDTVNGIYFRATGLFTSPGLQTVKLKGNGTPFASAISNFVVSYSGTQCVVAVTIFPVGGGVPAEIVLDGSPNDCIDYTLEGSYITGTALNASNKVILKVNVITPGTYNVSTTLSNGITFSAAGSFLNAGANTITLTGNGTPLITGPTNIPITIGTSSCSFSVDVVGPAAYTIDCGSAVVNGIYVAGEELDNSHEVVIDVNVTTPGGYNITGSINGMTFSAAGDFPAAGPTQVTLTASGIPTADGNFNVPLTGGTAPCNFPVTVEEGTTPPSSGTWKFTAEGVNYSGSMDGFTADNTVLPPMTTAVGQGSTSGGHILMFGISDASGGLRSNETYPFSASSGNVGAVFSFFDPSSNPLYEATVGESGVTLSFRTTATNQASTPKTITMTFSGNVKKTGGGNVAITNGELQVSY